MNKKTYNYLILLSISVIIFISTLIGTKIYNNRRCYKDLEAYLLTYSNNIKNYIDSSYEDEYTDLINDATEALSNKNYSAIATSKKQLKDFELELMNSNNATRISKVETLKLYIVSSLSKSDKEDIYKEINSLYDCKGKSEIDSKFNEIKETIYSKNRPITTSKIDEYNKFINDNKAILLTDAYYEDIYVKLNTKISYLSNCISSNDYPNVNMYIQECDNIISKYNRSKS